MIDVCALGTARITTHFGPLTPTATKRFALVLYLAAERGRRISRAMLGEYFFEGSTDAQTRHGLRELAYQLRQAGVPIDGDRHGLALDSALVRCDWFEVLGSSFIETATLRTIQSGFLPTYDPMLSEGFSDWLNSFRATQSIDLTKVCLKAIDAAKKASDLERAEQAARACLTLDPLNGHATIALAEVLTLRGSAKQATDLLDRYEADLGPSASQLAISVSALRKRIRETLSDNYATRMDFAFAGREMEMQLLSQLREDAQLRGPRCVLLSGEPGMGKSRIASEFALRSSLNGFAIVRTNAHPYDRQRPMGAMIDLVPHLLKQDGALGCSPDSMGWLNLLIGRKAPKREAERELSNSETAQAIARALVDVINAIAAETPLMLIVDDAQWVDDTSLVFLRDLAASRQPSGLLIVLASRDERHVLSIGGWHETLTTHTVGPLDRTTAETLIATELAALGEDDHSLVEWMADAAGGNPFFADCLVTNYRATRERFVVPSQLSSIVDQRIRSLSDGARDVLETVVALGKRATVTRLEKVLQETGPALLRFTRELGAARLITGDLEVRASHWLIVESVQRNAFPVSQRLLYRRIAMVLEDELNVAGDSAELWGCAETWVAAGEPQRAASMIAICAEHALSIGRAKEAADLYFRASTTVEGAHSEPYAEASIRAAISGGEGGRVLRAMPLLASRVGKRIHDDIELAEIRALFWGETEIIARLPALVECFHSDGTTLIHRLTAARAFLAVCGNGQLVQHAIDVRYLIESLLDEPTADEEEEHARLLCSALYHGLLGDVAELRLIVDSILVRAEDSRADRTAALLRVAGVALIRLGERARALGVWEQAHDVATNAGLDNLATEFRLTLASQHLDAGNLGAVQEWLGRITFDEDVPRTNLPVVYWELIAELALCQENRPRFLQACEQVVILNSEEAAIRPRRRGVALQVLAAHFREEPIDEVGIVAELTKHQIDGYENGDVGDFEIAVLARVLCERGTHNAAKACVTTYLKCTRVPEPLLSYLLICTCRSFDLLD